MAAALAVGLAMVAMHLTDTFAERSVGPLAMHSPTKPKSQAEHFRAKAVGCLERSLRVPSRISAPVLRACRPMADACSRSGFQRGSIGFASSRRAEKKKTPQLAGLKVDLSIRNAPPMTGPLGESEARNRRTRRPNSISTRVLLIFTIGGAPDEAYYRRITRIPSSSADSQGSAAPAPTFMDIAGGTASLRGGRLRQF